MDWKTWVLSWIPLVVVTVGWFLNSRTQQLQRDLDTRIKLHDLKVQEYAVWIEGTVHNFHRYIASHPRIPAQGSHVDTSMTRRKLTLSEDDPVLRKLMGDAIKVWPDERSDLAYDLYCEINSDPDFSYEPFDTIIDQITERIRATRPTK